MKPGLFTALSSNAAHETMGFLSFLSAPQRALPVGSSGLRFGFRFVEFGFARSYGFSPFLPCFSRDTRGRVASALLGAAFAGVPQPERPAKPEAELASTRRTGVCPLLCPREQ